MVDVHLGWKGVQANCTGWNGVLLAEEQQHCGWLEDWFFSGLLNHCQHTLLCFVHFCAQCLLWFCHLAHLPFAIYAPVSFVHWWFVNLLPLLSRPAFFEIVFMNSLILLSPTGCLVLAEVFLGGLKYSGPHVQNFAGCLHICNSNDFTQNRSSPDRNTCCMTSLFCFTSPSCLVFVSPSVRSMHSISHQMLSDNPYSISRVHSCRVGGSVAESM